MTTIIPQVTLTSRVIVRFRLFLCDKGRGTKYVPTAKYLFIPANQTIDLMRLSLNINAGDTVKIVVTVSDGKSLHLSQQWSPRKFALIIHKSMVANVAGLCR
jgi:curli production protein